MRSFALVVIILVALPSVSFAEKCTPPTEKPGEIYTRYLGQFDVAEINETTRKIVVDGKQVGLIRFAYQERGTDVVSLVYDIDGNFVGYGAETVRNSEHISTVLAEAVESATGLDFGGNVSIDSSPAIECVKENAKKKPAAAPVPDDDIAGRPLDGTDGLGVPFVEVPGLQRLPRGSVTVTDLPGGSAGNSEPQGAEVVPDADRDLVVQE